MHNKYPKEKAMEWLIPLEEEGLHDGVINTIFNKDYLKHNQKLFQNKNVVDLGCHDGQSSSLLSDLGADWVFAIDIRQDLIKSARTKNKTKPICFFTNDITNYGLVDALVSESQVVTCFGAFYHLTDNFTFLDHVCKDNIEYVIIETMFGAESPNAFLFPLFENTCHRGNGYHPKYSKVPVCQPNLSWIYQAINQIGFKLDYVEKYYRRTDFENLTDFETNKRMILKIYNPNLIKKTNYLKFKDIWEWNENNLVHEC